MKLTLTALFLAALAAPGGYQASTQYFTNVRQVVVAQPGRQNYIAIDQDVLGAFPS